jgi:hypothetical protein
MLECLLAMQEQMIAEMKAQQESMVAMIGHLMVTTHSFGNQRLG